MYWFNNNFSNLTKSILFPGSHAGAGSDHYAPPLNLHSPSDPSMGNSNPHRGYVPPDDNRAARSRADADDYADMQRNGLRRRAQDYGDNSDDRDDANRGPQGTAPKPKAPEKPIPEIFKKVPILPMGGNDKSAPPPANPPPASPPPALPPPPSPLLKPLLKK